jgi:adenine-specific DNA-methyltransferase
VSLDAFPEQLKSLVSLFSMNIAQYKGSQYDEANTRIDFIDKFFTLLNWDVANNQGFSESYRDVVREDKVKIDGSQKAPDYSFRIGGVRKFFVEAKKPAVNIKDAVEPAYQVRRYAYTAKLPLSILTDFEEFAIYDTRIKPNKNDKASVARVFYCTFDEYEQHFDFIHNTFSKEAINKGSFDKYIEENKNKKGTSEVDTELLNFIEEWRVELAKNIAQNNSNLSIYDLNTVVQKIIDRIMFIRIAEDKGIEDENLLFSVSKTSNIYEKLVLLFTKANAKYNSGLFARVDWIDRVSIDDKVLSNIIINLYYPECPYEFSVLPVEILGSIYERFLGKTIRFRAVKGDTHTAIIEKKPEVKKAGGVYYTPQYIVDYIVQNTVGEKIKNKTPQEISSIRICDPACGSGSFLVGAYQYLLNYHLDYYTQEKNIKTALKSEKIYEVAFKSYRLTIEEKQRILTSAIYGVDIDNQAVEVTKLSLYLKLLENEGKEAEGWLFRYSDKTLLPSLENNIKCGNSLIGTDFYAQPNLELTDDDRIKVNCFDWEKEFASIFRAGGFDVVIGNPPYVKEYTDRTVFENIKKSYMSKYYEGKMDLWYFFVCLGIDKLRENGLLGFIAPNNWITNAGASILRNKIVNESIIKKYFDFSDYMVFRDASIQTMVFILEKEKPSLAYNFLYNKLINKNIHIGELTSALVKNQKEERIQSYNVTINPELMQNQLITFINSSLNGVLEKIYNSGNYFLTNKNVAQGIVCPQDFVIDKHLEILKNDTIKKGYGIFVINNTEKKRLKPLRNEISVIKPYYTTNELQRFYGDLNNSLWVIYSDINVRKKIKDYPNIKSHLDKFKKIVTSDFAPYGLHRAREQAFFEGTKIISLRKTSKPCFTYTEFPCYVSQTYFVIKPDDINLKYLTAILNSNLIYFWLYHKGKKQGEQLQVDKEPLLDIPIVNTTDKAKHDHLVSLVDKMLELKQKEAAEKNQQLKTMITRQIEGVDKAIDTVVYELYGLTEDEIKVMERE